MITNVGVLTEVPLEDVLIKLKRSQGNETILMNTILGPPAIPVSHFGPPDTCRSDLQ